MLRSIVREGCSNAWHRAKYARYSDLPDNIYYCGSRQLRKHRLDLSNHHRRNNSVALLQTKISISLFID